MVKSRESFDQLLYKNTKTTFRTDSRTCSSASKLYSESLVLILKNRRSNNNYYESNGKLKRDLSIATDICILRNYCKRNRDKFSIKKDGKLNCNKTEVFSVNDFTDHGCGDSFDDITKTRVNFDLTALIIENLKSLVCDWIQTNLLDNDKTKEKVDSIVDRILHRLDVKSNSSCTYAIDVLVDPNLNDLTAIANAKKATIKHISSVTSVITLPLNVNDLKIMSTLSVPRHLLKQKHIISKDEICKDITKFNLQNEIKNRQSIVEMLTHSTKKEKLKSSEHKCMEVIDNSLNVIPQKRNQNLTINKTEINRLIEFHTVSSIERNIMNNYANSSLKRNAKTKFNETDVNNFKKQRTIKRINRYYSKHTKKINHRQKRNRNTNSNSLKYKILKKNDIVEHVKSIFDSISFIKKISKAKIDIAINVLPLTNKQQNKVNNSIESKTFRDFKSQHAPDKVSKNVINGLHTNKSQQMYFEKTGDILNPTPDFITLLNSTDSKQKTFGSDSNLTDTDANYLGKLINKDLVTTNGNEIATEIRELKEIIRSLAETAKEMLSKHLIAVGERRKEVNKNMDSKAKKIVTQKLTTEGVRQKHSKSVQISDIFQSNITTSKIVRNKNSPSINSRNIYQKSTSYRLFDSETILRVTDMTSGANSTLADKNSNAFDISTQISGSSIDSLENRHKLYTFYCNSIKKDEIYPRYMPINCSSKVYYIISDMKDSSTKNTTASSQDSGSSKGPNRDVERNLEERKRSIFDCFHNNFQRRFTVSMFFFVPFIITVSLIYLYLRGQFAFKPSPSIFPTLKDKRPLIISELGF